VFEGSSGRGIRCHTDKTAKQNIAGESCCTGPGDLRRYWDSLWFVARLLERDHELDLAFDNKSARRYARMS